VFLQVQKTTIDELHQKITSKFEISRSAVASMVGYIYSKLGILRSYKESYKTPIVYSLKEEYAEMLRTELESKNKQIAGI
jgi:predicted transcriptional regulator